MKCKHFLFSFFSCFYSFSSSSYIPLLFFNWSVIFFPCVSPPTIIIYPAYSSITFTIYEENMLTHQAYLKESLCEKKYFLQLASTQVLLPVNFLAVSNSLILVNCTKCIFRTLQIHLTAGFVISYYEIYSHSFILNCSFALQVSPSRHFNRNLTKVANSFDTSDHKILTQCF